MNILSIFQGIMSNSQLPNSSTSIIKLVKDIGRLFNNRQGSDAQFKIGGSTLSSTGETIYDSSAAVTMYAHTTILRCRSRHFEVMFENEKDWRERSGGVIHKPNTSPSVFYKILDYIYTGDLHVKTENLFEVMVAAEEMELEELSIKCQSDIIKALKKVISIKEENNKDIKEMEESNQQHLSVDDAVRTILIPTLIFTHRKTMTDLFQEIFSFTIINIRIILSSRGTRVAFFENIPTQIFQQILASDVLEMEEYDIWDLVFMWACFKTKVLKSTIEAHFRLESSLDHETESPDVTNENSKKETLISDEQLKQLKVKLSPMLPAIRFSLIDGDQYSRIIEMLSYFLPVRRMHDLNKFHAQSDKTRPLDTPRLNKKLETSSNTKKPENDTRTAPKKLEEGPKTLSKIIDKIESWQQMKTWIFESKGMDSIRSAGDVKLKLLFRASEHAFKSKAFHEYCDDKGPTLVIVKSSEGHQFGGVDFSHWKSNRNGSYSGSASNFIFALADGHHRNIQTKFLYSGKIDNITAIQTRSGCGPIFGGSDFCIYDNANTTVSCSYLPIYYNGNGASKTSLAGKQHFLVAEYEVFAIHTA